MLLRLESCPPHRHRLGATVTVTELTVESVHASFKVVRVLVIRVASGDSIVGCNE